MTVRDESVFDKAFKKMEKKGYFAELKTKTKAKTAVKSAPHRRTAASPAPGRGVTAMKVPLSAKKR